MTGRGNDGRVRRRAGSKTGLCVWRGRSLRRGYLGKEEWARAGIDAGGIDAGRLVRDDWDREIGRGRRRDEWHREAGAGR